MDNMELNMEEMEEVSGGKRHFKPEKDREGWTQYRVEQNDNLIKIAKKFGIPDYRKIQEWNPHIDKEKYMIRTGEYLWIKL